MGSQMSRTADYEIMRRNSMVECPRCHGCGDIIVGDEEDKERAGEYISILERCPDCEGEGEVLDQHAYDKAIKAYRLNQKEVSYDKTEKA